MAHTRKQGQGVPIIGYTRSGTPVHAIAGGDETAGSTVDQAVNALSAAAAGDEGGAPVGEVQPAQEGQAQPSDPNAGQPSGQDLIAPYLEGLDDSSRKVVAERLEKFRKDADSNANRKIQELSEKLRGFQAYTDNPDELRPVVDTYMWMMQEPHAALPWIVEQLTKPSDQGGLGFERDSIRDPLLEKLGITQPPSGGVTQGQPPTLGQPGIEGQESTDSPLTRTDLEKFFEEQKHEEENRQTQERLRQEQAEKLTTWTEDALKKHGLSEKITEDSPMRNFIFQQAHQLVRTKQVMNPQIAIETAVEQVKQFLGTQGVRTTDPGGAKPPTLANGGLPAQIPDNVDLRDPKQRKEFAASRLASMMSEE